MPFMPVIVLLIWLATPALGSEPIASEHAQRTLDIYRTIVEVDTSKARGNTIKVANYLAQQLLDAGFPPDDIKVIPKGDFASLVARYRGDGSSGEKPILLLGHMDVVEALEKDWEEINEVKEKKNP